MNHNLDWDIEIGDHINHLHGLKLEIDLFQIELRNTFEKEDSLDFSYHTRIKKKALEFGLDEKDYIEIVEDNQFLVEEWKKYFQI